MTGGTSHGMGQVYDPPGVDAIPDSPPIFFLCASDRCKGGASYSCLDGYEGVQCGDCKQGQFYYRGQCEIKCDDINVNGSPTTVTVFGIIAVVIVWIVLNKSAGGAYVRGVMGREHRYACMTSLGHPRRCARLVHSASYVISPKASMPQTNAPTHPQAAAQ
jgi:hypothetical protein